MYIQLLLFHSLPKLRATTVTMVSWTICLGHMMKSNRDKTLSIMVSQARQKVHVRWVYLCNFLKWTSLLTVSYMDTIHSSCAHPSSYPPTFAPHPFPPTFHLSCLLILVFDTIGLVDTSLKVRSNHLSLPGWLQNAHEMLAGVVSPIAMKVDTWLYKNMFTIHVY